MTDQPPLIQESRVQAQRINGIGEPQALQLYPLGRPMRALAGCDESILAECPEERFKFSGFGTIILFTASLAGLSMTLALRILFPETSMRLLVPFGGLWAMFVLAFDRWLISTHVQGKRQGRSRLLMAVFFGIIVAEPLVLTVFEDVVLERIATERQDGVSDLGGRLDLCNPEATESVPAPIAPEGCEVGEVLNLAPPLLVSVPEADEREADRELLREEIGVLSDDINRRLAELDGEIAGKVGSGKEGDGPVASSIRQGIEAQQGQRDALQERLDRIDQAVDDNRQARQDAIEARIAALNDYNRQRSDAVEARVGAQLVVVEDRPGFALRMDTLTDLTWESETIFLSRLLLTVFLILIDASPAIVRRSTSDGAYEAIYASRAEKRIAAASGDTQPVASEPLNGAGRFRVYDIVDPYRVDLRERHAGFGSG